MSSQGFKKQSGKGVAGQHAYQASQAGKSNYQLKKEILMRKGYTDKEAHAEISRYWKKSRKKR